MTDSRATEPILIAEDNSDDAMLLKIALQKSGSNPPIHIVENGLKAIEYLCGDAPYNDRLTYPFPSVVYTDLKMPLKDGFEVLQWIKAHPECSIIPVVIMTSSEQDRDIRRAYELGANSYIVKPSSLDQLTKIVKTALEYWTYCAKPAHLAKC
jgi:CheY-like chemotaxis protein